MNAIAKQVAEKLLQIKAIKLEPTNHFVWASGWNSPIYCDNRKALSYPDVRDFVRDSFIEVIKENCGEYDVIAGVATGAIAQGALVADKLHKPFVYVRSQAKDHGLGNLIEGDLPEGSKVLVIEDLISTGGSSLNAVKALREAKCEVVGMAAIFTYGFQKSVDAFKEANVNLVTLSNYNVLVEQAKEIGYISESDIEVLKQWRTSPDTWKK